MNLILKYLILFILVSVAGVVRANDTAREQYLQLVSSLLIAPEYAYGYESFLYSGAGKEIPVSKKSVIVRDQLALYTCTEDTEYLVNEEGSIMINKSTKKITLFYDPYSEKEIKGFSSGLGQIMEDKLMKSVYASDSVSISVINGYTVYSVFDANSEYARSECWVDATGGISEVRYFYRDGEYVYLRIKYFPVDMEKFREHTRFSYYVNIKNEKFTPTAEYKAYEITVGK